MVLALTIVIPGMAELGTTHLPAGAAYILFASGDLGWGDLKISCWVWPYRTSPQCA